VQNFIIEFINQFGYLAIGLLIAVENIFPPIPSEVILTLGGFMTVYAGLNFWLVVLSATIGSLTGAVILYNVGRLITPESLRKLLFGNLGRVLRLKMADIHRASHWFATQGTWTVFFCRFIPILRSLISIPAGAAKMHRVIFLVLTALGSMIWNAILVWLGALAGESWANNLQLINTYSRLIWVLIGLAGLIFLLYRLYSQRK